MSPAGRERATTLPYPVVAATLLIGTVLGGVIVGLALGLAWWWWVFLAVMAAGVQITNFIAFQAQAKANSDR